MAPRAVRVITEVAAVDRPFDYALTEATDQAALGDRVRVELQHRSVRGWVIEEAEWSPDLKPVKKWLGLGPPASTLPLWRWAGERWYGPWSRFLAGASPPRVVVTLPAAPAAAPLDAALRATVTATSPGVVQLAPTTDPLGLVLASYEATRERPGSLLVLVPTDGWAGRLRGRLEQRGLAVASGEEQWDRMRAGWPVIVGARGAALAPTPRVAGAVVIDADDEAFRSSATPTWDAVTLLRERCRRDDAPLWCTSIIPSPTLLDGGGYAKDADLASGWPRVLVADRRGSDPHEGVLARVALDAAHRAIEGGEPVAVVVISQRLGAGRLLACGRCGELARCVVCRQAESEVTDQLMCAERHDPRAKFCRHCGATSLRRLAVGVTTLARDVAAQLGRPVSEVSAAQAPAALERVVVGTEAVWSRVRRSGVVVFADFDQYLLAPRASARRAAITAVGKAGRLVGSRGEARGEVVLQTRRGDDEVVTALRGAQFDAVVADDVATAELLGLAPYRASAAISGEGASEFVAQLASERVNVVETSTGYVAQADDVATLTQALRVTPRPTQRLRVAVQ